MKQEDFQDKTTDAEISLRAIEPEDLDMLYAIENDMETWGVGPTNVPYSRYVLHDYMAHASNDIYVDGQVRLMIQCGDKAIGVVDIVDFAPKHLRAEVGIMIAKQYRGMGYGDAVMSKIVDYSRKVIHLHQLYAIISVENKSSLSLFSHAGFNTQCALKEWLYDGERFVDAMLLQLFL